jgi:hypothetical protein
VSQVVEAGSIASEVGVSSAQRQHQPELDALRFFAYGLYVFHKLCQSRLGEAEGGIDEISEDQYTRSTAGVFLAAQTE